MAPTTLPDHTTRKTPALLTLLLLFSIGFLGLSMPATADHGGITKPANWSVACPDAPATEGVKVTWDRMPGATEYYIAIDHAFEEFGVMFSPDADGLTGGQQSAVLRRSDWRPGEVRVEFHGWRHGPDNSDYHPVFETKRIVNCDLSPPTLSGARQVHGWTNQNTLEGFSYGESYSGLGNLQVRYTDSDILGTFRNWESIDNFNGAMSATGSSPIDLPRGDVDLDLRVFNRYGGSTTLTSAIQMQHDRWIPTLSMGSSHDYGGSTLLGGVPWDSYFTSNDVSTSWSVRDDLSGLNHQRIGIGSATDSCGTILGANAPLSQRSKTFNDVGDFGHFRLCYDATDNADNTRNHDATFYIDAMPPEITSFEPFDGAFSLNPFEPIKANYRDVDGLADLVKPQKTVVDVTKVQLFVDGVEIANDWRRSCGEKAKIMLFGVPGAGSGGDEGPACRLHITESGLRYDPVQPWTTGLHTVTLNIADTSWPGGEATRTWSFFVNPVAVADGDADGIPDTTEGILCGQAFFRNALASLEDQAGRCNSNTDLDVLAGGVMLLVPMSATLGPDADGDGMPRDVFFERWRVTFTDDELHPAVAVAPADPLVVPVDPDDSKALVPVRDEHILPAPVPLAATLGPDFDGDGVPAYVELHESTVTIDTREGQQDVRTAPASSRFVTLDSKDADDTYPVPRLDSGPHSLVERSTGDGVHYRLGAAFTYNGVAYDFVQEDTIDAALLPYTVTVPTGATPTVGPDADGDGIPAYLDVPQKTVTINDNPGLTQSEAPATARRVVLDGNDADPNWPVPQVGITDGPYSTVEPAGGDGVHYKIGFVLNVGTTSHDLIFEDTIDAALLPYTVRVPDGTTTTGADADGDGIPSNVAVGMMDLTIEDEAGSTTTAPANAATVAVDPDDADPSWPVPVITSGPHRLVERSTGDGIHYKLGAAVVVKGIPLNLVAEDIIDAGALPAVVVVPAFTAPSMGPDMDGDGIPAHVSLGMTQWTIQDDEALSTSTAPSSPAAFPLDPDDQDPAVPTVDPVTVTVPIVPATGPDADQDGVPAHVTVQAYDVTLDAQGPEPVAVTRNVAADESVVLDGNDADPTTPAGGRVSQTFPSNVAMGPDADGDGLPAYATVEWRRVTVDRFSADPVTVERAEELDQNVPVDGGSLGNDADPGQPVQDAVRVTVASNVAPGPDADGDGVPATATVEYSDVTVHRGGTYTVTRNPGADQTHGADPNDADPNDPAASTWTLDGVPLWASFGPDADGDGIPASAQVETYSVTVDRTDPAVVTTTRTPEDDPALPPIDPNDADPNDPAPGLDGDGDRVPDDAEWFFCDRDNTALRSDGSCPPGSDDWTPPTTADVIADVEWLTA